MTVARLCRSGVLLAVFVASWLLAYTAPQGPFAGLTADDFFYLGRAWRILAGELPDRDFADPGAPLTLALSAAAQLWLGRGAWAEVVLSATAIAIGTTLTCWLALRVSGSVMAAVVAAVLPLALQPHLFSYPVILALSLSVATLWRYVHHPTPTSRVLLAAVTVAGFLFRHDLGLLTALAAVTCIGCTNRHIVSDRARECGLYGLLVVLLAVPYLAYVQANGGLAAHSVTSVGWARGALSAAAPGPASRESFQAAYYLLQAIPLVAALTIASRFAAASVSSASAPLLVALIAMALALNVTALRSPHTTSLAGAWVPHAILLGWIVAAHARVLRGVSTEAAQAPTGAFSRVLAGAVVLVVTATTVTAARGLDKPARHLHLLDGTTGDAVRDQTYRLMTTWPLEAWSHRLASGPARIAFYLRDCTLPTQTVFVADALPQLTALADRPFAGRHPDLRPGFFTSERDQQAIIASLERDRTALVMAPIEERYGPVRDSFPLLHAYLATRYERLLTRVKDQDITVDLLVRKDPTAGGWNIMATGWYEPMRWPCFRQWHSSNFRD